MTSHADFPVERICSRRLRENRSKKKKHPGKEIDHRRVLKSDPRMPAMLHAWNLKRKNQEIKLQRGILQEEKKNGTSGLFDVAEG